MFEKGYFLIKRREGEEVTEYTLYMDESETFNSNGDKYFVMSGVIIKKKSYFDIEAALNKVKQIVWDYETGCERYILHEKDISFASNRLNSKRLNTVPACYHIFQNKHKVQLLYNELSKLFKRMDILILGVCLDKSVLHFCYGENKLNNQFAIAIQLLVEHYCQFLIKNEAIGDICYEAMQPEQNTKIQQRIYELKALGTLYYAPKTIQDHLKQIHFVAKKDNLAGLQLADFVPNTLGRYAAKMKPKNRDFAKNVRSKLYDGRTGNKYKFGFKILS